MATFESLGMTNNNRLRVYNAPSVSGAWRLDLDPNDMALAAYIDNFDCWVNAAGTTVDTPFQIWARIGRVGRLLSPSSPGVKKEYINGVPALTFPAAASQFLLADYTIPRSYTVYAAFSMDTAVLTGAIGSQDPSGNGMLLQFNGGGAATMMLRHNGSDSNQQVTQGSSFYVNGTISICWGAFRASDLTAVIGGMNTSNGHVHKNAQQTKTFTVQHKSAVRTRFGAATGSVAHHIYQIIVCQGALPLDNAATHVNILTALATRYGITVES
jgi:hypothetical protein